MTKRLVYAIRRNRYFKSYEAVVEYMPGYVKSFMAPSITKITQEVQEALDNKVPTLSGAIKVDNND
jgi:hypothetical protein